MTKISKTLVVFTAAACIAFLAFVIVTSAGGPNWEAEADQLQSYYLEQTGGDNPQWVAKSRNTGEAAGPGTKSRAGAIVNARKKIQSELKAESNKLDAELASVKKRLEEAKALIEVDLKAMEKREAELTAELTALRQQIGESANEGIRKAQQAQTVQAQAKLRREDVYRLQNQLAEIRTDTFRARQQAEKLNDEIWRVAGNLDRLKRRNTQLEKAAAGSPGKARESYEPPTEPKPGS